MTTTTTTTRTKSRLAIYQIANVSCFGSSGGCGVETCAACCCAFLLLAPKWNFEAQRHITLEWAAAATATRQDLTAIVCFGFASGWRRRWRHFVSVFVF